MRFVFFFLYILHHRHWCENSYSKIEHIYHGILKPTLVLRRHSGLTKWRHSGMTKWRHSGLTKWRHSFMTEWRHSGLTEWRHSGLPKWRHSGMWRHSGLTKWRHSGLPKRRHSGMTKFGNLSEGEKFGDEIWEPLGRREIGGRNCFRVLFRFKNRPKGYQSEWSVLLAHDA